MSNRPTTSAVERMAMAKHPNGIGRTVGVPGPAPRNSSDGSVMDAAQRVQGLNEFVERLTQEVAEIANRVYGALESPDDSGAGAAPANDGNVNFLHDRITILTNRLDVLSAHVARLHSL